MLHFARLQDFFDDVGPLQSMQLGSKTLEGVYQVFDSYVNMLVKALPNSLEEEASFEGAGSKIVRMAENEAQQIALLANASLLADELLPRAAMKFSQSNQADRQNRNPELREWKKRLLSSVDRLKNSFCQFHALDLIFTEEGDSNLSADMYISMDGSAEDNEWFPSPIFRVLSITSSMFHISEYTDTTPVQSAIFCFVSPFACYWLGLFFQLFVKYFSGDVS